MKLASPDATQSLRIFENFLATEEDRRILREGIRLGRKICRNPAFDSVRGVEVLPGRGVNSDATLDDYLSESTGTAHHPVGTCRMGSDANAVVDPWLRVRGVEGLRVVDASVMPEITSGNTNAPVMMIAERAVDFIRQQWRQNKGVSTPSIEATMPPGQ